MDATIQDQKSLIMVVDDNPEFLDGIELTLEMEGFKVWTANNGKSALEQLEKAFLLKQRTGGSGMDGLPDLILADIMMPEMDGYEFYDKVRANPFTNHIPFIFLTAKSGEENIRQGKELGADDYFSKLAPPEDLLASVRGKIKRVEQRRQINEEVVGDPTKSLMSGSFVAIAVIGSLVMAAFCLGIAFATGFLGL
ncbi:MAG TPA: response regulator [Anaerolineae bacterium]|nr:response regulator [Anaerolineae bacterium]MCB0225315.1 response regulator [Anaerolineae bacterium]MCB9109463.1 response regulator [Anaerolineales bacterium]HRV91709.1 response regulator [Anaerolineae bacterium]